MTEAGHIPGHLVFALDDRNPEAGLGSGLCPARLAHGYGDLRHLPSVLVENHSLKPYRQRVLGTYVLIEASLRLLGEQGATLLAATRQDADARVDRVPVAWGDGPMTTVPFLGAESEPYPSTISGRTEVRWTGRPKSYAALPFRRGGVGLSRSRPKAYWVPATKTEVIDRLRLHGVTMEIQTEARTLMAGMYRLADPQPATAPFEGRTPVRTGVREELRSETFPPGSARVPTDQPLGELAMVLLEPEARDSLFAWGFFPEILQRTEYIEGYVIAPLAERMLREDPKLKTEFEAKLASDATFAGDPEARLRWFYEHSPYYDENYLLYPVGIERSVTPIE